MHVEKDSHLGPAEGRFPGHGASGLGSSRCIGACTRVASGQAIRISGPRATTRSRNGYSAINSTCALPAAAASRQPSRTGTEQGKIAWSANLDGIVENSWPGFRTPLERLLWFASVISPRQFCRIEVDPNWILGERW